MPFPDFVIREALLRSRFQCECRRSTCGHTRGYYSDRCVTKITGGNFHAHHIIAESKNGPDNLVNCQILCVPCHQKTDSYGRH